MQHSPFELRARDGVILQAQAWEPADAPQAILGIVHGLGEHSARYAAIVQSFTRAGIVVVTYDQRGHGCTGGRLPPFATLLDDIDLLIAEMRRRGDWPQFLFGQSLGGDLVLNYALRRRPALAGVIASSPLLTPAVPPPAWKLTLARVLSLVWPGCPLPSGVSPDGLSHDPDVVRRYREDPLVHGHVSAILGTSMLDAGAWALEHADQLTLPLLLMHGSGDRLTSAESSRLFASRAGSLCTLQIWEGLFHELHFEPEREQVLDCIHDWIGQVLQIADGR
jgi:alpha-beta hydrolase superfamily lysophospholipase